MKRGMIRKIDHIVITTSNLQNCIFFYESLGFLARQHKERWELISDTFKLNVHLLHHEFLPKAKHVTPGSCDLCFEVDIPLTSCRKILEQKGIKVESGIVNRHGVKGTMQSIYIRDPDGNLIELCTYE